MKKPVSKTEKNIPGPGRKPLKIDHGGETLINRLSLILGCIAALAFVNTFFHQFALDDRAVTFQNKYVMSGITGIPKILSTFYWAGYWDNNAGLFRPLSLIMFAIEWQISPNNPALHHVINVLLYSLSIALLFRFLTRLLKDYSVWLSFSIALLFALHPIHTEVVANIKSRDEILCFLFFITTAILLIRSDSFNVKNTVWATLSFFACLLSKEGGILYLPIFVLILFLFRKNSMLDIFRKTVSLFGISIIWLVYHTTVIKSAAMAKITYSYWDNSLVACDSLASQVATGFSILGRYILKSFWPYEMSYDYSFAQIPCESFGSLNVLATLLVCIALGITAIMQFKKQPLLAFGIAFFFITSVLFINVFTLIGATMADRFIYVSSLGTLSAIVWLFYKLNNEVNVLNWQHRSLYIVIFISLAFGYKTFTRNFDWKNDATLFTADVKVADRSSRTHYNYGTVLFSDLPQDESQKFARLDSAIAEFRKGISIDSNDYNSYTNMGAALYRRKLYAESIESTRHAMRIKPDSDLLVNLADAFFMNKDYDSSIYYHTVAIRTGRPQKDTYNLLGSAFFARNQFPLAVQVFRDGIAKDSTYGALWLNYGNALGVMKDYNAAIYAFNKAYELDNTQKNALYFISVTYANMGDTIKANEYLQRFNAVK